MSGPIKLKGFSVRQPWAELIIRGIKQFEYRSVPTNIRGRVYVYASLGESGLDEDIEQEISDELEAPVRALSRGVVVGTVEITDCSEDDSGFAWHLANPERLDQPIPPMERPQPVWFHPFGKPETSTGANSGTSSATSTIAPSPRSPGPAVHESVSTPYQPDDTHTLTSPIYVPASEANQAPASAISGITPFHACYYAHELTRLGTLGNMERISATLYDSKVDLNPHQVEAALFALSNPLQKGVILADEVGLGKTIEAGLVLCQKWAERQRRLIIVAPAHIRKQWQNELNDKFNLPAMVIDRKVWNDLRRDGSANPLNCGKIVIISYSFAARMKDELRAIPFDLVVFDEAHKLRNAYQPSRKGGQAVRWAFEKRQKVLLTATPLQNSLLELYGLGWLIGDHVFGDKNSFQSRYCRSGGDLTELRQRLSQVCKRTLRKECAYVNYTRRQAMTHPFKQTDEEKSLTHDVTEFMLREASYAIPKRQRHLIEIILFKTLASSPQALASTLVTMRERLIAMRDGLTEEEEQNFIDAISRDKELDIEGLMDQLDVDLDEVQTPDITGPIDGRVLADEVAQLDSLIARAQAIETDSKSKALLQALSAAFARLDTLGASRKALIFTESRRTQEFLASYLEANGYRGKVVTFNGSNTHPSAKVAYTRFVNRHTGTDRITGSKAVDIRSALIEEFQHHGQILLATEAAAEGVNLQFCSLVVNYDLPWNPQRIEQRIGRCHRYGQKHDVVVVNFLSQDNLADQRVQDLLQQKFSLFDGLFGASDEVLGAIEDGIDFESRVVSILKSCRTDAEIETAFDQLTKELEATITQKMATARQQLLEHFDADVHERLKVCGQDAQSALDRVGQRFWKLTQWALSDRVEFEQQPPGFYLEQAPSGDIPTGTYRLISTTRADTSATENEAHLLRLSSPLGVWILSQAKSSAPATGTVRLNLSGHERKISMLAGHLNTTGYLRLDKLTLESDTREEFLLLTAINGAGENLDQEIAGRLLDLDGEVHDATTVPADIQQRLQADAQRLIQATQARATESGNARFKQVQTQVNQWADDKIAAAELELDSLRREIRTARREAELAENMAAQQAAQERIGQLETRRRKARRHIDDVEEQVETERQALLKQLRERCTQQQALEHLFTVRYDIV